MSTLNTNFFCSNLNSLNTFIKEMGSSNVVKLSKVGSNVIVPAPHRDKAQNLFPWTLRYHIPSSFMVQRWVGAHPFAQLHKICAICSRLKKERLGLTIKPHVVLHILLCDEGACVLLALWHYAVMFFVLFDYLIFLVFMGAIWFGLDQNACATSLESS